MEIEIPVTNLLKSSNQSNQNEFKLEIIKSKREILIKQKPHISMTSISSVTKTAATNFTNMVNSNANNNNNNNNKELRSNNASVKFALGSPASEKDQDSDSNLSKESLSNNNISKNIKDSKKRVHPASDNLLNGAIKKRNTTTTTTTNNNNNNNNYEQDSSDSSTFQESTNNIVYNENDDNALDGFSSFSNQKTNTSSLRPNLVKRSSSSSFIKIEKIKKTSRIIEEVEKENDEEEADNDEVFDDKSNFLNSNNNNNENLEDSNSKLANNDDNNNIDDTQNESNLNDENTTTSQLISTDKDDLGDSGKKRGRKRGRKRSSLMVNGQLNHGTHLTQILIYKWPIGQEEHEMLEKETKSSDEGKVNSEILFKMFINSNQDDLYVLQEQISEYLDVKSFKRKHPDMNRRFLDVKERVFLKELKLVTETQCDLGLNALRLSDVVDLMANEYREKYTEFTNYLNEKRRMYKSQKNIPKSSQFRKLNDELNLTDGKSMKDFIRKAMLSVASYNNSLMKEKQVERTKFFDIQTMTIQTPRKEIVPNLDGTNNRMAYPLALVPGQYQAPFKKYSNDELKYLPLTTPVYDAPAPDEKLSYLEWKRQLNRKTTQPSVLVAANSVRKLNSSNLPHQQNSLSQVQHSPSQSRHQQQSHENSSPSSLISKRLAEKLNRYEEERMEAESLPSTSKSTPSSSIRLIASAAPTVAKLIGSSNPSSNSLINANSSVTTISTTIAPPSDATSANTKTCYICKKTSTHPQTLSYKFTDKNNQIMIDCSTCNRSAHPDCLELNPDLADWVCIRQYGWQCMECKLCNLCQKAHDEDKMMFCDRCDRGFHTYCAGVNQVPEGSWLCKKCTEFKEKLDSINEKIRANSRKETVTKFSTNTKHETVVSKVSSHSPQLTPEKRGRGRPPGSLNKPKDPEVILKKLEAKKAHNSMLLNGSSNQNDIADLNDTDNTMNTSYKFINDYSNRDYNEMSNQNNTHNPLVYDQYSYYTYPNQQLYPQSQQSAATYFSDSTSGQYVFG